jgi:outer membrane receptor protein involved in Fe transport
VPYQPDYLENYEAGWKTQWWDRRLRWNGAIFWENWNNFQFGFLVPPSITAITNAGNARIKGIENELVLQPTVHLTMSANFTILQAVTTQNFCSNVGVTDCPNDSAGAPFLPPTYTFNGPLVPAGTDLPQAPKFKGNVVLRYVFDDIGSWQPFGQVAYMYQSTVAPKLKWNEQAIIGFQPSYGLLDLSAGASRNKTDLTVYVSNVTDERAQLTRFSNISPNNDNQVYVVPAQPRTFGLRISQNF